MAMFLSTYLRENAGRRELTDPRNFLKITKLADSQAGKSEIEYDRNSESEVTRWMATKGYGGDRIAYVAHNFDKKDPINQGKVDTLTAITNGDFRLDLPELNGNEYEHLGPSASGSRTCTTAYFERDFKSKFIDWYTLRMGDKVFLHMPMEKLMVYMLQAFSATKLWKDGFDTHTQEIMPEPNVSEVVLCTDFVHFTDPTEVLEVLAGKVKKKLKKVKDKHSDGIIILILNTLEEVEAFTARFPFLKGLVVPVARATLNKLFAGHKVIDAWQREHDPDKVSMIWVQSSFKGSVVWNTPEEFDDFLKQAIKEGFGIRVCKQTHPENIRRLPVQPAQAVMPDAEQERIFINKGMEKLHQVETIEGMAEMLGNKYERQAAKLMPDYLGEPIVNNAIQTKHIGNVRVALSGCIADVLNYVFAAPDVYPILCHCFGVEPKFVIPAGYVAVNHKRIGYGKLHVVEPGKKFMLIAGHKDRKISKPRKLKLKDKQVKLKLKTYRYGQRMVVIRNPTGTRGILIRYNMEIPEELKGLYMGSTCFFSCLDTSMHVLSMDYDGDTVGIFAARRPEYEKLEKLKAELAELTEDPTKEKEAKAMEKRIKKLEKRVHEDEFGWAYYEALKETWKKTHYRCVYFENATPKTPYTEEGSKAATIAMEASPVGLVANAITRLIDVQSAELDNMSPEDAAAVERDLIILEAALTMCIDAAKNGVDPDVKATMEVANSIIENLMKTTPAPMHTFWKKQVKTEDIIRCDYDLDMVVREKMPHRFDGSPKFVRRDNWLGRYTAEVQKTIPVKLPIDKFIEEGKMQKWCPDGLKSMTAQWRMFGRSVAKSTADFGYNGVRYNHDTHTTVWDTTFMGKVVGFFVGLRSRYSSKKLKEVLKKLVPASRKRIFEYAKETHGMDPQQTVATILMKFYTMNHSPEAANERILLADIKDTLWMLFGNIFLENLKMNLVDKQMMTVEEIEEVIQEETDDQTVGFFDDGSFMEHSDADLEAMAAGQSNEEIYFGGDIGDDYGDDEIGFYGD